MFSSQRDYLTTTSYDTIILGTSLLESIIASSLARNHEKILHLDLFEFYGGEAACSLTLDQLHGMMQERRDEPIETLHQHIPLLSNEYLLPFAYSSPVQPISSLSHSNNDAFLSQQHSQRKTRQYALDLQSKFLFCSGPMVKLLISSRIGRYLEFKCMDAISIYLDDSWAKVPCSKGEIFKSKIISLRDKRYMTKFMKLCMDEEAFGALSEEERKMGFVEYLRNVQKLSETLIRVICFAITLMNSLDEPLTVEQGLRRVHMYIESIGRYGTTSFLYPVYGLSELPQSFCRVGAVYGGTYVLKSSVQNLIVERGADGEPLRCTGLQCNMGQRLNARRVICSSSFSEVTSEDDSASCSSILRSIVITRQPILDPLDFKNQSNPRQMYHPHHGALLMIVPPNTFGEAQTHCIHIVQLDFTSKVCPKDEYVISFQTECQDEGVLRQCMEKFIQETYEQEEQVMEEATAGVVASEAQGVDAVPENGETSPAAAEEASTQQITTTKTVQHQNILYRVGYRCKIRNSTSTPLSNVLQVNSMTCDLHCEDILEEARKIFHQFYPSDIFLEQLPNPDVESQIYDENAKLLGVDQEQSKSGAEVPSEETHTEESATNQSTEQTSSESTSDETAPTEIPQEPNQTESIE